MDYSKLNYQVLSSAATMIMKYEGFSSKPYLCPANVWTIGYGTTRYPDGPVKSTDAPITELKAFELLEIDLLNTYNDISRVIKVKLHNNQFIALLSFVYNCGLGALTTSIAAKINNNPYDIAISQTMNQYNKSKGKVLNGLVTRRKAEVDLYYKKS